MRGSHSAATRAQMSESHRVWWIKRQQQAPRLASVPTVAPDFEPYTCGCGAEFFPTQQEPEITRRLCSSCRAERVEQIIGQRRLAAD